MESSDSAKSPEIPMDEVLRRLEETEEYRKIIEDVSEGSEVRSATEMQNIWRTFRRCQVR